ncbi:MAG: hypothetical protein MMC33_004970 [Icmadophila ericetorum]|nr:hypothetical protein [Icmadophila ericetorum]
MNPQSSPLTRLSFADLPFDIRIIIYETQFHMKNEVFMVDFPVLSEVYSEQELIQRYGTPRSPFIKGSISFLRTCRLIRDEATEVLYGRNTFHIPYRNGFPREKKAFEEIGARNRGLIRNIKFEAYFDEFLYKAPQSTSPLLQYFTNTAMAQLGLPEIHQSSLASLQTQTHLLYEHLSSFHACKDPNLATIEVYATVDCDPDVRLVVIKCLLLAFRDHLTLNYPQLPTSGRTCGPFFYQFFVQHYAKLLPAPLGDMAINTTGADGNDLVSVTFRRTYA